MLPCLGKAWRQLRRLNTRVRSPQNASVSVYSCYQFRLLAGMVAQRLGSVTFLAPGRVVETFIVALARVSGMGRTRQSLIRRYFRVDLIRVCGSTKHIRIGPKPPRFGVSEGVA
jgi:hypothetical protein